MSKQQTPVSEHSRALFFPTSNVHKVTEVEAILTELLPEWRVYTLQDFPDWAVEVAETGDSYEANARLKVWPYADNPLGLPVIADDSGVEVTALPGLLGIYSHRWYVGSDADRVAALLGKLSTCDNRELVYRCCFALLVPTEGEAVPPVIQYFMGELRGQAACEACGTTGFGYDPIMIPDGYEQTLAELSQEEKNKISHRRRALEGLAEYVKATRS